MKIGVLGCLWGNAELIPRTLEPWIALKKSGVPLTIAATHVQFKEYADMGAPEDPEGFEALHALGGDIDFISTGDPMLEHEVRNAALEALLTAGVDLVWMLDGDELYTRRQIEDSLIYIEATPRWDYYHMHLDNRVPPGLKFEEDFCPPRIIRTGRHDGIDRFVWDNELRFKDGALLSQCTPGIIPKRIAHVEHRTWGGDIRKKIAYQRAHFGYSPYYFDEASGAAALDDAYFVRFHGMPAPTGGALLKKPALDVFVRTHSSGNYRPNMARVTDGLGGKPELMVRSLRSLIDALNVVCRENKYDVRLVAIDDHSDPGLLAKLKGMLSLCPFEATLEHLEGRGNAASMERALTLARERGREFIYLVEDDYLHEPSALIEMLQAQRDFSRNMDRQVALFPVDYRDYYLPRALAPTRVVAGPRRHWRLSYTTTSTFFITKPILEKHWDLFLKNPQSESTNPAGMTEVGSLNVIWQEHVPLFTPIPTLAYHMHREEEMPPFSNWRKLWDTLGDLP